MNAGKYLSSITVGILNIFKLYTNYSLIRMYVSAYIITTLYSYIWDVTMDWSLLRLKSKHLFLRSNLIFSPIYYYIAMITNLILRFSWTLTLFIDTSFHGSMFGINVFVFFISFCEIFRRIHWSIIRLENENYNHDKKYFMEVSIVSEDDE